MNLHIVDFSVLLANWLTVRCCWKTDKPLNLSDGHKLGINWELLDIKNDSAIIDGI